jgi:signal transduction histidine kinase
MIKLESVKSDFLANISHEFRTPINIIDSTVQLLYKYNQVNNSSEKYAEYLNILKHNSNRILRLVDSVIDVAKLSNDFYDVSLRKGNIVQAIEEIAMSSVVYANENNRNIIFDTDQEEFNLAFDINKLEKIMLNLISNAIKFSYENTDIEVEINTELDKEKIFVFVRNNGPKIPESERERIFEKFTQINNLFVRESEGSGIGLFLVKKFIELHEGEIYVEDVGEITQFTFYLPKKSSKENEVLEDKKIMDKSILDKCDIAFSDI